MAKGEAASLLDPVTRGRWVSENLDAERKKLEYYIDAIHYLYNRYRDGKRLPSLTELGEFSEAVITSTLSYMIRELKGETYKKILDLIKAVEKEPKGLERFMG